MTNTTVLIICDDQKEIRITYHAPEEGQRELVGVRIGSETTLYFPPDMVEALAERLIGTIAGIKKGGNKDV